MPHVFDIVTHLPVLPSHLCQYEHSVSCTQIGVVAFINAYTGMHRALRSPRSPTNPGRHAPHWAVVFWHGPRFSAVQLGVAEQLTLFNAVLTTDMMFLMLSGLPVSPSKMARSASSRWAVVVGRTVETNFTLSMAPKVSKTLSVQFSLKPVSSCPNGN
jgi:hypothetical protein